MVHLPKRLLSIDILRAVTMLLMIFVNDVDGVRNIPEWIKHVKSETDGLGFADTIFPAFLFIVGLSLPFAIKNRLDKGKSTYEVALYIINRSFALIVMGFFHVNSESYSDAAYLPRPVWLLLATVAFFLIWLDYDANIFKLKKNVLVGSGALMLIVLAYLYKGEDSENMQMSWGGILGIIGKAYLVCALLFLAVRGRLSILAVFYIVFVLINVTAHLNLLPFNFWLIGDASSQVLVSGGVLISLVYTRLVESKKTTLIWSYFTISGLALIVQGLIIRPYTEGISKIHSTPAWIFICTGIAIIAFVFFVFVVDVKGKADWFKIIRPAGTSTLTCYLIPYIIYTLFEICNISYPDILSFGVPGIIRSFAIAFAVILIVEMLEKVKIRLKV